MPTQRLLSAKSAVLLLIDVQEKFAPIMSDPQTLIDRVQPLTQASDPWRHSAREISALLLRREGDMTRAGQLFKELADDPTAPAGIRARAAELAAITGK